MLRNRVTIGLILGISSVVLADAKSDYEMLFGDEAKKAAATASPKDDVELAAKVLTAAKMATDAPESQVYFYQKAYELGIQDPSGHASAMEALNLLEKAVPERRLEWQTKRLSVLESAYQRARGSSRRTAAQAYLDMLLSVAEAAAAAGKAKEAWDLYRKAHPVAMYVRSPHLAVIGKKIKEMSELAVAVERRQEQLKSLMSKLAADPQDMKARTELILFCIAELDQPAKAASLLTKGVDEKLAALVTLAAKKAEDVPVESCLDLGNWYYETLLGTASTPGKAALLRRAATYYQQFLTLYTKRDVKRLNANLVLEEIKKKLAAMGQPGLPAVGAEGTIYACADDKYELRVNGTAVLANDNWQNVKSAKVRLKVGDVIAAKLTNAASGWGNQRGFCMLFLGKEKGIDLSTNTSTWFAYSPKDKEKWWSAETGGKSPRAARGTNRQLAKNVVKAAQQSPVGLCMSIWGASDACFLYHVVTAGDVVKLKRVSQDATYEVSSKGKASSWGRPVEPKAFLLTGQEKGPYPSEYAFLTAKEAAPNIVITLKDICVIRRLVIENRRRQRQDAAAGLTVWVSTNKNRWTQVWKADSVQAWWQIDLRSGARAKYVKIGLPREGTLHLATVRIYGEAG